MDLQLLMEGQAFTLYAILQGEDVEEYLGELEKRDARAHDQIVRRLQQLAERGPSRKRDQFNNLGRDLYEAKATSGPRVVFFYDRDRIVICSHAFDKQTQRTPRREIERALSRKRDYLTRKASGQGFVIHKADEEPEPRRQP